MCYEIKIPDFMHTAFINSLKSLLLDKFVAITWRVIKYNKLHKSINATLNYETILDGVDSFITTLTLYVVFYMINGTSFSFPAANK